MRENVVFLLLSGMLLLLGGTLLVRSRELHVPPSTETSATAVPVASVPSAAPASAASRSSPVPAELTPSQPKSKLGRPLRVVGLGWDALAPGVLANDGLDESVDAKKSKFRNAGLDVAFDAVDAADKLEKALARGGGDARGADVAILPLPKLVAGWERLRALNLAMFYVTAWSRGREMVASKNVGLDAFPARGDVVVGGVAGDAAAFLAIFALDLAGVDPSRIKLESTASPSALLVARTKTNRSQERTDQTDTVLSTADASHLIPWVAVAQRSLLSDHTDSLITFAKAWHAGQLLVEKDATRAARKIGGFEKAPEPLSLLERLGEISPLSLADNAELFGLSGRGAVTLETLFARTWRLWREVRLLTTPPPEPAPIVDTIVLGLARSDPKLLKQSEPESPKKRPRLAAGRPLLVRRIAARKLDEEAVALELGTLGAIFSRSPLRLTLEPGGPRKKIEALAALATDRYALAADRISVGTAAHTPGAVAVIEVLEPH